MASPLLQAPNRGIEVAARVQVDFASMEGSIGRIKAPPICMHDTLKKEAMSTEELAKLSFPLEIPRKGALCTEVDLHNFPSVVSSSSSTASRESALSDVEGSNKFLSTPVRLERKASSQINLKVTAQKTSRSGRQTQRWHTDASSQRVYRMVSGCVPIVEGGRVLFVSASRKPEWILPKGGWEKDEAIEESAIRECFEEAGVLGVLGPRLEDCDYETRKAKKRRLEFEEVEKKTKLQKKPDAAIATSHGSVEDTPRILKPTKISPTDETSSVASDASQSHTHIRLSLFVLYVSEVKSSWPESGRSRKVVDIDEAIKMCESRPEFLKALKEVKKRNLHHLPKHEVHNLKR